MKTGNQLRDEGIQLVSNNNPDWIDEAYSVIAELARRKQPFTSDDVWKNVTSLPKNNSAMGAVFRIAVADKIVVPTQQFILSARPSAHSRPIRVWMGI
jgi:hypothetical protein